MIGVKQKRKGRGPLISWKLIQTLHLALGGPVNQKTQNVIHYDGIVNALALLVGLSHENDASPLFGDKQTLHGGHRGRLMLCHVAAVQISGGKNLRNARYQPGNHAHA